MLQPAWRRLDASVVAIAAAPVQRVDGKNHGSTARAKRLPSQYDRFDFTRKGTMDADAVEAARIERREKNNGLADMIVAHKPGVDSDTESEAIYDEFSDSDFP